MSSSFINAVANLSPIYACSLGLLMNKRRKTPNLIFCDLKIGAKFHKPWTTPSGRKLCGGEKKKDNPEKFCYCRWGSLLTCCRSCLKDEGILYFVVALLTCMDQQNPPIKNNLIKMARLVKG